MAATSPNPSEQQVKLTLVRQKRQVQFFVESLNQETGIEMLLIPAGTFLMGSPEDELDRLDREGPQHEVSIPTFFMGKYPVTQVQWRFVAGLPPVGRELKLNPSNFEGDERPVEQVSWYDASEFCGRLSTYTGREYRLPTEAEWEYACRSGTTTPFHFGETITTDVANYYGFDRKIANTFYKGSYGQGSLGECRENTTPVNYFGTANAFGLCDMHGNVLEWCIDQWHDNYVGAPINGSAWFTDGDEIRRVLRGGSWDFNPRSCRSAYRLGLLPDTRDSYIGLRVVCSAP